MADLQILISAPDPDQAADLLKAALLWDGDNAELSHARLSAAAGAAPGPASAVPLILTVPAAILNVQDLVDRIRKRRRAQALIETAQYLRSVNNTQVTLVDVDGARHAIDRLTADQLLEIAAKLARATQPPAVTQRVDIAERTQLLKAPPRVIPLLDQGDFPVWYGTNRRPLDPGNNTPGYSSERDTSVHQGQCRVYIPASHKIGSTGSPWWKRLLTMTDDRLHLLSVEAQQADTFWQSIRTHLAGAPLDEQTAVIFIHGYNVSFEDAAVRAAQIGFDLSVRGAMAFFSWPSRGQLDGYFDDEATIEVSESAITGFIVDFVERSGAQAVHIIAHSMGNRGLLRAVNRIAAQARQRTGAWFGEIILAAADVDADLFRQLSAAYAQVARRTTLYVSARDRAVEASRWLHGFPRAGLLPPVLVVPAIDTVNVTNADLTLLGHGYVADARDVLQDMHDLITNGTPPERRFGLRQTQDAAGSRFWLIGA